MIVTLREEQMWEGMTKWYVEGLSRPLVFHKFTLPDLGDPHDHPFWFHSFVIEGGYREEIFDVTTGASHFEDHHVGDTFIRGQHHVHRIVELFGPFCETMIMPFGEPDHRNGLYQFRDDGIWHRFHDGDWAKIA